LPEGTLGRLMINSDVMARKFLNNPVLERSLVTNNGYMDTDDYGMIVNGYLYMHGRIGDQILYRNRIIGAADIERVINEHSKVVESLVKGVPGPLGSKADPRAYIVLKPGVERSDMLADEFKFLVQSQLELPYWLRGGVKFMDSFPRSAADKVYRNLLD